VDDKFTVIKKVREIDNLRITSTVLIQSKWNLATWQHMSRQQTCSFLIFDFYDFWRENDIMNMPTNFEIQNYTAFERTCKIREIAEIVSQIWLFNPKIWIFEIWKSAILLTKNSTKWRKFQFSKINIFGLNNDIWYIISAISLILHVLSNAMINLVFF